ncbi:MAG: amidohydrolase, partial [Planctomycetales bacterium]
MSAAHLTRRHFLQTGLAACSASLILPRAFIGAEPPRRRIRYIDIHTHLGAFYADRELTADLLVRFMDAHNVEKACVLPLISPESAPVV